MCVMCVMCCDVLYILIHRNDSSDVEIVLMVERMDVYSSICILLLSMYVFI